MKDVSIVKRLVQDLMVDIPAGTVQMRDDRTNSAWTDKIQGFQLAKFQVTQELYFQISGNSPSVFKGNRLPVESVSWIESIQFCNQLSELLGLEEYYQLDGESESVTINENAHGFRLPTESEWQYACQTGNKEIRHGKLEEIAWFKGNSMSQTHEVGSKLPNDWGLYDMLGNVWEWCSDIYDESVYGSYRVLRGGGWNDLERSVMATNRRRSHPISFKIDDLGFRLARNH